MSCRRARWAVLPIALLIGSSTAASASAYTVTVNVHGAGKVTELTPRALMDCSTSTDVSESTVTPCVAGTPGGLYAYGDIVELEASVPSTPYARGWRFSRWVDSAAGGGRINCDPQNAAGDHTSARCKFQIFENLRIELYFDDGAGPQDTAITSKPGSLTNSTSATFAFDAPSDPDASYECKLDAGQYSTCGSPSDKGEALSGLSNGSHTFAVRAKDPSGNVDASPATWTWTVDTVAPTVTIGGTPGHNSVTSSTATAFSLSASESVASMQCTFDGGPTTCPGPATVGEGLHSFTARAVDHAGNVGPVATRAWTVDTSAPEVAIAGAPADGAITNSTTADFTITADPGTRSCTLDGESVDCEAPMTGLEPGVHTFVAQVTDAGGTGSASRSWTVDTDDPVVTLAGIPADGAVTPSRTAFFDATADEVATITCELDGTARPCGEPIAGLADGEHTFTATAQDAAGNSGAASRTWTVDTVAPDTSVTGGPAEGSATDASAAFTFAANEAGASFACRLDGGAWAACASPHLLEGLATGEHVLEVRATDAAGNTDDSPARRAWRVGTVDPGSGAGDPSGGIPQPSEVSVIPARLARKWRVRGKRTIVRRLRLTTLPADALVRVRCQGERCPVKARSARPGATGVVDLRKVLRRKPLRAGQRLTITITAPGRVTRVIVLRPREGRAPRGGAVLCLPAGASAPAAC